MAFPRASKKHDKAKTKVEVWLVEIGMGITPRVVIHTKKKLNRTEVEEALKEIRTTQREALEKPIMLVRSE